MSDIESGEKQDTSLDASREVPERTHKDTTKEARLHGQQCLFIASLFESDSQVFLVTLPKRGFGYFSSPSPRGQSSAPCGNGTWDNAPNRSEHGELYQNHRAEIKCGGDENKKSHNCVKWILARNAFCEVMEALSVGHAMTPPRHVGDGHSPTLSLSVCHPQPKSRLP